MVEAKCMANTTKDARVFHVLVHAAPHACVGMCAFIILRFRKTSAGICTIRCMDSDPSFLKANLSPRSRGDQYLNVCAGNSDGDLGCSHVQATEAEWSGAHNSAGKSARLARL